MAILLQFDFPFPGPFGQAMADALDGLAQSIAAEPGLLWKIWTEDAAGQRAGGIYLFADRAAAERYRDMHAARLGSFGITDIRALLFDVNAPLTAITRGPTSA